MTVTDCFVSVVSPLGNDAAIVRDFVRETMTMLRQHYANYELVLVDDGSEDDTVDIVTDLQREYECVRLIRLSRRFGEEIAIFAGLDSVIGDYVVVMLPNSDPPAVVPEMVRCARDSGGIVFGVAEGQRQSLLMRAGAALFHWYCRRVAHLNLPRNTTQFRVLSRQAVNALTQVRNMYRYLRVLSTHVGYRSRSFPYRPLNRSGESQRRPFLPALNAAIDIAVTSSGHPLRFVSWLGVFAGVCNALYALYVVLIFALKDEVAEGWTTLSLQNAAMFFLVFLILTVSSEYLGQILVETKDRPPYHVLEERTSAVLIADENRRNIVTDSSRPPVEAQK